MVYLLADNDLEDEGLDDLRDMAKLPASPAFSVIVLCDRAEDYDEGSVLGLPNWEGAKLLEAGGGKLRELEDWREPDMGEGAVLSRFVQRSAALFPAKRYALVFWDHGAGWKGFGSDESSEDDEGLELPEIREGLSEGMRKAGIPKLELVGFDACLMACEETAFALRGLSRYLLASEELEPGHGWRFASFAAIAKEPTIGGLALGRELIAGYERTARAEDTEGETTLSLVDLDRAAPIAEALEAARSALSEISEEELMTLSRARSRMISFGRSVSDDDAMVDIQAMAATMSAIPSLSAVGGRLAEALASAVQESYDGVYGGSAGGLSLYFPEAARRYDPDYPSRGIEAWGLFLESYFSALGSIEAEARFMDEGGLAKVAFAEGSITLEAFLEEGQAAHVASAFLRYGLREGGTVAILGEEPALVDPSSQSVSGQWDMSLLLLRQDGMEGRAYQRRTVSGPGQSLYAVPFAYYRNGDAEGPWEQVELRLEVDDETDEVLSERFYRKTPSGAYGPLKPVRGSKLKPLALVDRGGLEAFEPWGKALFDPTRLESLEYDFEDLEGGERSIRAELVVRGASGRESLVFYEGPPEEEE